MKSLSYLLLTFSAMTLACTSQRPDYPETRKTDVTDDYFGTLVPDPYRWLEDDRSEETTEWVKAENKVTSAYLDKIPFREDIRKRLTEIWNYPRESAPWYDGGFYFYTRNDGLQNQSVYYMMKDLDAEPREFLDPNAFSEDGTVALTAFNVSRDGKFLGYGISRGGSDWQEFKVRDMQSGEDLADDLRWIKFSDIAWEGDGFYYSRYPEPSSGDELKGENTNHRLYYHRAGTSQEQDLLVYEDPEHPDRNYYPTVTEDEKFLVLTVAESTSGNALYFENLEKKDAGMVQLVQDFRNDYFFMDNLGNDLLVVTNDGAPNYCLLRIPADLPERENWKVMIPEKSDRVLQNIAMAGNKMLVTYLKDARSLVEVYDQDGNFLYDLDLPGIGTVGSINARKESNIAFYTFTSFTYPSVVFKYNTEDNCSELYRKSEVDFNPDDYITEQVFYESKDGTKVPMFIVHRKDVQLDGSNPALLYGYGGFNISLTPSFSVSRLVWLEQGGIYAVANIRGGGEYGKEWHDAGTLMNKQNVFDDFIAAAHYLIDKKYTNRDKLAVMGGSNGGLLIGAVVNQEPELFRVAIPEVGVMDMLRYHKFTIGRHWATDYGTSEDSKEMFEYLYAYSPLHNIREGLNYPAILVTTADHDDRVVPAHSFKYIATLQEKYRGKNPVLIRIETQAGHGGGMPTSKIIDELTDIYSFIFFNMGIRPVY